MTLDVLICSLNKGIVRIDELLRPVRPDVRYVISYQYTDERYLELIPKSLRSRPDVTLYKHHGKGLSANRNLAMEKATADLVMFADDDTRFCEQSFDYIFRLFTEHPEVDVAFMRASTYTGKLLKAYPEEACRLTDSEPCYSISIIEMACRRSKVQGTVRFDERFGLGTQFLTCGEEEIWMEDAFKAKLQIYYFPEKVVETSTMLKKSLIYVDAGVQRSKGAITYYKYGKRAWWLCLRFAMNAASQKMCHFWPMFRHLIEGINYIRRTK